MNEFKNKREEILFLINKYQKKIYLLQNDLINVEKNIAKISEKDIINTLSLSEQQKKIVEADHDNILVIACPGAGKTHTLISRYINMVVVKQVKPESVLLITFTNKAGQEMLKRMEEIIPNKLPFYVGSLHGLSYRILQKYYNINYTIIDEYETRDIIKSETNNFLSNLNSDIDEEEIRLIKSKICYIIDQVSTAYPLNFKLILKKINLLKHITIIQQIYKAFIKKKKQENYIDFNDLMIMFCDFLKSNKSDEFKNQIKYVFFDEYQDINPIQNYILSVFKGKSKIMVVGDDAQSIYSFRGSSVNFILDFPKIFTPNEKYLLVENYRSTPAIVNFCEEIIKKNTNQFKKEVKSIQEDLGMLPDIHAFDKKITKEFTSREDQYKWVVNDIINKYNSGVKLSDIVILARKNNILDKIELELLINKIPFVKQLGISLLNKPHIKDYLALIIILNNPKSSIHWKRIISLHKGLSITKANEIVETSSDVFIKIKELSKTNNQMLQLVSLFNLIKNTNKDIEKAKYILTYLENLWLIKNRNFENERKDILNLLFFLRNSSLNEFISELYLNRNLEIDIINKVFLSTVHGSKGLEWNHVYIIDINNNEFPLIRTSYFKDELDDMEEERRLFYVACSRAKKYLTLTYHVDQNTNISPFLRELDPKYFIGVDINKDNLMLINYIPKDVTTIIKNMGHQNICELLKNLNVKEKSIHNELILKTKDIKNKKNIGTFFDHLIPKIIQNHYFDKIKKFDINLEQKDKIYYDYIDENTHWSNNIENILKLINDIQVEKLILNEECSKFLKDMESGIIKLVDLFKPKVIYSHYNINFDVLKAELDLLFDDVIIEIKFCENDACNLHYICQTLTYGYLMFKKDIKINKICIYNVKSGLIHIIDTSNFDYDEFYKRFYSI
jgi:DNA helicase-2/ATP-dependent DNA helicase PcrA